MPAERAVLVNGSRLMRDLLKRVIEKFTDIEVARELSNLDLLASVITATDANWLFIVLIPGDALPKELIEKLLLDHPKLRIVSFWTDGSHVKTEWLDHEERDFVGITLAELTTFLQKELWTDDSPNNGKQTFDKPDS